MKLLKLTVFAIFVATALFGALLMQHPRGHHALPNENCFASAMQGVATCPNETNPQTLFHHLSALRQFTLAVIFSLLIVVFFFILQKISWKITPLLQIATVPPHKRRKIASSQERFMEWFSLHEKRDPLGMNQ